MARICQSTGFLLAASLVASIAVAQDDAATLRASFNSAYQRYLDAVSAANLDETARAAEESLRLGRQVFGDVNQNTANLTQNYAAALELQGFSRAARDAYRQALEIVGELHGVNSPEKVPILMSLGGLYLGGFGEADTDVLREALAIQRQSAPDDLAAYASLAVEAGRLLTRADPTRAAAGEILRPLLAELESAFGREAVELIPVLMVLGKAEADQFDRADQERRYRRAIEIAEKQLAGDALQLAALELEAGRDLLYMARTDSGEHYLRGALDTYQDVLGAEHELTATAAMSLGELRYMQDRFSSAEPFLLEALEFFAGKPQYQPFEQRIRTILVDAYERAGDSDAATEHLIELGRLVQVADTQALVPIFTVAAEYPERDAAARRQGRVVVGFTVDRTGRTKDHFIVSSDVNDSMDQAAMDAVRRYRFAPRIVNGSPVDVPNQSASIVFTLVD